MQEESEYSREKLLRADFWAFSTAIVKHWHLWVGTFFGLGIVSLLAASNIVIPSGAVPWIAAFGIVIASFFTWRNERRQKEIVELRLTHLLLADANRRASPKIKKDALNKLVEEIGILASIDDDSRKEIAKEHHLESCLSNLRKIEAGEIPVIGQEAAFFHLWLTRAKNYSGTQSVRAYIRLTAFKTQDLGTLNWFQDFYNKVSKMVRSGILTIRYIYLLPENEIDEAVAAYFRNIQTFAEEIRVIRRSGRHLNPEDLRPSIVLFETQEFAFTHDRADNAAMLQASEWISKKDFARLSQQYKKLEMASELYYKRDEPPALGIAG